MNNMNYNQYQQPYNTGYSNYGMTPPKKGALSRWEEWNFYYNSKKTWWAVGVVAAILALWLALVGLFAFFTNKALENASVPTGNFSIPDPEALGQLPLGGAIFGMLFMIWMSIAFAFLLTYLCIVYSIKSMNPNAFKLATIFHKLTLAFNFLHYLPVLLAINKYIDGPSEEEKAIADWEQTIISNFGYNPTWGSGNRTLALAGTNQGGYGQPSYGPQQATAQFNPYGQPNMQQPQYGPQQATAQFNPYGQPNMQQPTGQYNPYGQPNMQQPQPNPYGQYNQPNMQQPQYGPQQPTGQYNPYGQPNMQQQPNPYGQYNQPNPNPQANPYGNYQGYPYPNNNQGQGSY
ncbi:polyadenylate binding domain-containing protein [Mycoplasmopsis primatum]|uniref:hypothetical protein n=1 Tax=Mycoplasmopsis primatum TaxID=55604 RepID=UPI0004979DBA|nr:hypothetical protein [Mycoplasmopsis primatum]